MITTKKPDVKPGDVVFFKTAKENTQRRTPEISFKGGHAFGVVLGIVPPFTPEPTVNQLMSLIGQIGYISFDDVGAFLGKEALTNCITKFQDKYHPKPKPAPPALVESPT